MKKRVKKILELNVDNKNNKKYEMKAIWDSAIYAKKSEGYLLNLYSLVK